MPSFLPENRIRFLRTSEFPRTKVYLANSSCWGGEGRRGGVRVGMEWDVMAGCREGRSWRGFFGGSV